MKNIFITALLISAATVASAQEQQRVIATVNGAKITAGDIAKKMWWQFSAQSLSELIDEKLLLEEAGRLKITADPKETEKRLSDLAAGYKDKKDFDLSLKSVGWTQTDVKTLIAKQMRIKNTVIAAKQINFTDADVQTFFEQNKAQFAQPEGAQLKQIYVATKAEADEAWQVLGAGADFAKISALKSSDENLRKRAGDAGIVAKGALPAELEKEIFSLKPGQYSKPLATGNGFSIFKMEALKAGEAAKLTDTLKASLKDGMTGQAVSQKLPELVNELRAKAKIEVNKPI